MKLIITISLAFTISAARAESRVEKAEQELLDVVAQVDDLEREIREQILEDRKVTFETRQKQNELEKLKRLKDSTATMLEVVKASAKSKGTKSNGNKQTQAPTKQAQTTWSTVREALKPRLDELTATRGQIDKLEQKQKELEEEIQQRHASALITWWDSIGYEAVEVRPPKSVRSNKAVAKIYTEQAQRLNEALSSLEYWSKEYHAPDATVRRRARLQKFVADKTSSIRERDLAGMLTEARGIAESEYPDEAFLIIAANGPEETHRARR